MADLNKVIEVYKEITKRKKSMTWHYTQLQKEFRKRQPNMELVKALQKQVELSITLLKEYLNDNTRIE